MSNFDDTANVIAPPPLLYGAALAAGLALDFLVLRMPTGQPAAVRFSLATVCVLAALVLIGGALTGFRRAGTPAEPWQASTAIVTDGVYGYTRNPMYVAMTLFYVAIALAADSLITLLLLLPLLIVVHYGVVLREERYLERKFGDAYRRYKSAVRRWV
jgi:protein-S-isoprenylcysteine O-methyltransferase Ste14